VREFPDHLFVFFATRSGIVKKTPLSEFSRPRANGIWAIDLPGGDELVHVSLTDGQRDIMLFSSSGKCIRFAESDVRSMGRVARGVIGIRLQEGQSLVSMLVLGDGDVLTVTENGYGKRTAVADHPRQGRGGQGVIGIQTSERNGALIAAIQVASEDDIMLITDGGSLVRTGAGEISTLGRNTQGVRLIRPREDEKLVGLERIQPEAENGAGEETPPDEPGS
jgi:DNA gyrase subunit A